mmetsp:Transcript_58085/g.132744  ORF Transcript_58085/g.132744 Transcript_58085/m.132744 type:complete len:223 (-) Transcript_58085:410-1078(-)
MTTMISTTPTRKERFQKRSFVLIGSSTNTKTTSCSMMASGCRLCSCRCRLRSRSRLCPHSGGLDLSNPLDHIFHLVGLLRKLKHSIAERLPRRILFTHKGPSAVADRVRLNRRLPELTRAVPRVIGIHGVLARDNGLYLRLLLLTRPDRTAVAGHVGLYLRIQLPARAIPRAVARDTSRLQFRLPLLARPDRSAVADLVGLYLRLQLLTRAASRAVARDNGL